jgi:glycosyltransferase involved in cell wall biosynthesis
VRRVAYVCSDPGVPTFGRKGASVHVQEVIRALLAEGASVDLFALRTGGPVPHGLERVPVHSIRVDTSVAPPERELRLLAANELVRRAIVDGGPFDIVYERYALWAYAGMAAAQMMGSPGLLEVNAPLVAEQERHRGLHHKRLAERTSARAFRAAAALLAVSPAVAAYLEALPEAAGRVHVVENAVDPYRFDLPRRAEGDGVTIGFVGTLKPWHGVRDLLDAFAELAVGRPSLTLILVGDGPERQALEGHASRRGLTGRVIWLGAVDPATVPALLAGIDVAVAPYPPLTDFYFSPLKVFEYLASGAAVVASRVGTLPQLVRHEVEGLLYEPGDVYGLTEVLERLVDDAALRRVLGAAGRAAVRARHTWRGVARRILSLGGGIPAEA